MERNKLACLFMLLTAALYLSGCSAARMAVPADLKESSQMLVCKGRGGFDESFTMGAYNIREVKRGWTRKSAWGFLGYSSSNARQNFEFTLVTPGGEQWQGQGATNLKLKELEREAWGGTLKSTLSEKENLVARCSGPAGEWTLVLSLDTEENLLKGIFNSGNQTYQITGTHKLAGSPMPLYDASGYLISRGGRQLAAVEVINNGAVWLSRDLSGGERDLLAAAAAALLLYQDLEH